MYQMRSICLKEQAIEGNIQSLVIINTQLVVFAHLCEKMRRHFVRTCGVVLSQRDEVGVDLIVGRRDISRVCRVSAGKLDWVADGCWAQTQKTIDSFGLLWIDCRALVVALHRLV